MAAASNWFRNLLKKLFVLGRREGQPWRHALPLRLETLAERLEPCRSLLWFSVGDLWRAVLDTLVAVRGRPRQAGARPRTPARRLLLLEVLEDRTAPATLTVTTATDNNPSDQGSLRAAIAQANTDAHNGTSDTIVFASSLAGQTITLNSSLGALNLSGAGTGTITIDGAGQMTISGNNASTVLAVQSGVQALLEGLSIEGGNGNSGVSGGGIYNNGGTVTVSDSTIAHNDASYFGGGIYNNGGTVTVSDSTIADNSASAFSGGGIYNGGGTVTVSDSTIANNSAYQGGGISNYQGTVTVSDSTIANNSASSVGPGGGIFNYSGTVTVSDSTLANNSAFSGGGIFNYQGTVTLLSSIVAANTASFGPDVSGSVSGSDNLIGDGSRMSGISNGTNGNQVGSSGSVLNPDLLPLGNYGGFTQTMPLGANSPALNTGGPLTTLTSTIGAAGTTFTVANAAAISSTPGTFDLEVDGEQILVNYTSGNSFTVVQRGYNGTTQASPSSGDAVFLALDQSGRARVIGGQTDIGAAETLLVTTTSDSVAHSGFSLRDALTQANTDASNGISDLIVFASSLNGQTITLNSSLGALKLSGAGTGTITIDGAGQMTISGNNASTVLAVQSGVQALLEGLTIENGQGNFGSFASGGGIYNNGGTLTVSDSTLADNSASSEGGGIYNKGGTVTVSDSTLANNYASYGGGGIFNYSGTVTVSDSTLANNSSVGSGGGIYNGGTVTVSDSTLDHNSASHSGGGIYNDTGTVTVSDSTLANNSAVGSGGGIYNDTGTVTVSDSTLDHNSAGGSGGGIYNDTGTVTVSDSTLANNSAAVSGGGTSNAGGTVTVSDSTLADNSAAVGAGISNNYGTVTVSDSTLDHNSASYGGGIYNYTGTVTVSDSTLAHNSAANQGGGIYNAGGTVTLLSAIVAANTASSADPDVYGSVSGSYNLIGDGSGMTGISNGSNGNLVGVTGSNPDVINPDLLPLGYYGGPTPTMPLAANSPALNAGGPLTTLTSAIGAAGTTFTVLDAAAITSTPGTFDLQVDSEQILVSYTSGNSFTVIQRGYDGTTVATHSSTANVFLAQDQIGNDRVGNGVTDIGAFQSDQIISFTAPFSPITFAPNETVNLSASGGGSGNPVTFSIDSSSTGTGNISGSTLTVTGAGTFVLDANQAGNSLYQAGRPGPADPGGQPDQSDHLLHPANLANRLFRERDGQSQRQRRHLRQPGSVQH